MEWEVSIVDIRDTGNLAKFDSGQPFEMANVEVKDHETLERKFVKAQFCKDPAKLPSGDVLWLRDYHDNVLREPMRIRVLEMLPNPYQAYE